MKHVLTAASQESMGRTKDRGLGQSQDISTKGSHSQCFADSSSTLPEEWGSSICCAASSGSGLENRRRGYSIDSSGNRPKTRGRQKVKSFELSKRALNPREKMFRTSDEDVDIRSAWFKRSKRGLS